MKTVFHNYQAIIEDVIKRADVCFVGVVTPDNRPYVVPMNFGYVNGIIYLHSAPTGRIINCLDQNPNVCVTFSIDHELAFQHPEVACSYRMKSKSVVAFGKVQFVEEMEAKREALNIIMRQYSDKEFQYSDPAVRNVKIWVVSVDEISCKEFGAPHDKYKAQKDKA